MKNDEEPKKDFDAVEFMRKRRQRINKEIKGMTPDEELKFFAEQVVEYKRRKKK